MDDEQRTYLAIDLKSFYASVECMERGLDPLHDNLVVADSSRTEKTICLAVSPSLKQYGIPGRARLYQVVQRIRELNRGRNESDQITFTIATPRMALYMEYSTRIYNLYLKYVSEEDIHVYSVDEVFIDVTDYLTLYKTTARKLAGDMIRNVLSETGITATAGIGTNLYLCKIAMDIVAKHIPADKDGVRIAELTQMSYREQLWSHRPLTDFWRVGPGIAKKLEANGLNTMGDIARCSIGRPTDYFNEDLLYRLFGVNAELLIDHAWGYEPCTIAQIKAYRPENNSLSNGQVLTGPYPFDKARLVVWEMTDALVLQLVEKHLMADQFVLTVGYDVENLTDETRRKNYHGEVTIDRYGREVPKAAHGSISLGRYTSSSDLFLRSAMELFDRIVDKNLLVRRMYVVANHVIRQKDAKEANAFVQMDLFSDYGLGAGPADEKKPAPSEEKEQKMQEAMLAIKKKYGKNAILKGANLQEGATAMERNRQIGGHKA
ncbi:MAG: DNA methylase [Lachnospiraceae bacterium]|nr:DNA methylase [Lachnospiraceae bacterium]